MAIVTLIEISVVICERFVPLCSMARFVEASSITHPDMAPDGGPRLFAIQANVIQDDSGKCGAALNQQHR